MVAQQDSSKFINSSKLTFISIPKNIFSNMLHEMKNIILHMLIKILIY